RPHRRARQRPDGPRRARAARRDLGRARRLAPRRPRRAAERRRAPGPAHRGLPLRARRPAVADLQFAAEGSPDDTGWFLWPIDAAAHEAAPDQPLRWLGDPWPLAARAGVDVDELVALGREQSREALHGEGRRIAQRTRSQAITGARGELLAHLATDLAKGVAPFDPSGLAGPRPAA
ncbi:MAG: hypothetical protein LC790_11890, partial [Actinobacteria bacterium]|nr:hypothetical protein [Actinomycetota bacterium]